MGLKLSSTPIKLGHQTDALYNKHETSILLCASCTNLHAHTLSCI